MNFPTCGGFGRTGCCEKSSTFAATEKPESWITVLDNMDDTLSPLQLREERYYLFSGILYAGEKLVVVVAEITCHLLSKTVIHWMYAAYDCYHLPLTRDQSSISSGAFPCRHLTISSNWRNDADISKWLKPVGPNPPLSSTQLSLQGEPLALLMPHCKLLLSGCSMSFYS